MHKFRMPADLPLHRKLATLMPMVSGRGLGLFIGSFLVVALLELAAVGLLPAFIGTLTGARGFLERAGLGVVADLAGADDSQIIVAFGAALAAFFVLKNLLIAALTYSQAVFVADRQANLSARVLSAYLRRPYTFHLQRNTADLVGYATGVSFNVFACVVLPGSIVLTEALVAVLVTALLLAVSPFATLLAVGITGGASLAFYVLFRSRLHRLGERQLAERAELQKWVTQALGGIKEAIILGREQFFVDTYARLAVAYSRHNVVLQTVGTLQRLFIETAVVCGLVLVLLALARSGVRVESALPTLALFGVAALRLMPSATRIVGALTMIRFHEPSVDAIARELADEKPGAQLPFSASAARFELQSEIELRSLGYTYQGTTRPALHGVSLRIEKGSMVGFVGRSGAGKSTLVDILIGLHAPTHGLVLVDGRDISADVGAWQRNIGYVPQSIFVTDDSLRRNVAFGVADGEIDDAGVMRAINAAQLGDFVRGLPRGLDTMVGERGSRISGGQRQRIGFARALYRDPEVLVLDEPTSALDRQTAEDVASVLASLSGRKTVLVIAHQISSVRLCNRIFLLRDGTLAAADTYETLAKSYPEFQSLVE